MYFSKLEHESDPCRVYYIQITEFRPQKFWVSLSGGGPSFVFPTRPGDARGLGNTFWEPCSIFAYNMANSQTVLMYIVFLNIIKPGLYIQREATCLTCLWMYYQNDFLARPPATQGMFPERDGQKPRWQFYKEWNRADSRQFLPSRKGASHAISSLALWSKQPGEQPHYGFTHFFTSLIERLRWWCRRDRRMYRMGGTRMMTKGGAACSSMRVSLKAICPPASPFIHRIY